MKIDTNQVQELLEKLSSRQPNSAKPLTNNDADASLQANFSSFIDEASQPTQTDTKAVQQAQKLLLSGQLETLENIRAAAENIIKFGI
jgi:hypothetical protein